MLKILQGNSELEDNEIYKNMMNFIIERPPYDFWSATFEWVHSLIRLEIRSLVITWEGNHENSESISYEVDG